MTEQKDESFAGKAPNISFHKSWMEYHVRTKIRRTLRKSKLYIHKENLTVIKLFRVSAQVTGALKSILGIHSQSCVKLASVSVWVSVWVIWRIKNRHTFRILPILNSAYFTAWYDELRIGILLKYAELRIGSILKVCRFLIRHTLPHGMTIWRRHSVKYAELRIGILLKVCRFLIRHTLPNADL